ncbi:MAG: fumarylacetoacetate hydrolase family protein [Acidimicrobiia bacterium]
MKVVALPGGLGRLDDDGSVAELDLAAGSLAGILGACTGPAEARDLLARAAVRAVHAPDEAAPSSVVGPGASVWGIGLNYRSKQEATGRALPAMPTLFIKSPAAVVDPGRPIVLPGASEAVDLEAEMAVVVGAHLYEADLLTANAAVFGIAAANDVTARDVMRRTGNPSLAKSYPSFGQFGGVLATRDELGDLGQVAVRSWVDGELWQSDTSAGLLHGVGELLSLLSHHVVLRPGDVVLTGTPAGTGDERRRYLAAGSTVAVAVGDLPPLVADVVGVPSTVDA